MPKKESDTIKSTRITVIGGIIVAIIGLCGTLILGYWQFVVVPNRQTPTGETEYIGRVLDVDTQQPIAGAKITLDLEGVPPIVYSDSEGLYRFKVAITSNISGQVRVDAQGYQVYTRNITISPDIKTIEDIRLTLQPSVPVDTSSVPTNTLLPAISPALTSTSTLEIIINESRSSSNYDGKVTLTIETIEMRANNRMRWHISFWNQSDRTASMAFGTDKSYASDENGTEYEVLSMEPPNFFELGIKANTKLSGWLEFNEPVNNARDFKLFLVRWTYGSQQLRYDAPFEFSLP